jgi:hypothetical protein
MFLPLPPTDTTHRLYHYMNSVPLANTQNAIPYIIFIHQYVSDEYASKRDTLLVVDGHVSPRMLFVFICDLLLGN